MLILNISLILLPDIGKALEKLTEAFLKKILARFIRVLLTSKNKTNYIFGISM